MPTVREPVSPEERAGGLSDTGSTNGRDYRGGMRCGGEKKIVVIIIVVIIGSSEKSRLGRVRFPHYKRKTEGPWRMTLKPLRIYSYLRVFSSIYT